jgi:hypothetical protein
MFQFREHSSFFVCKRVYSCVLFYEGPVVDPISGSQLGATGQSPLMRVTGGNVGVSEILIQIDREIAQLQQARVLLGGGAAVASKKGKAAAPLAAKKTVKKKRNLTPEGRKRIAEAVKRRWAEQKKSASSK